MYKIILAFRYLLKRRISYLAFSAVALCVFIVVVVMTVLTGLVSDFKQKNHSFVGDCVVGTESLVGFAYYEDFVKILGEENFVEGVSAVIKNYGLVNPLGTEQNLSLEIIGIDPVRHSRVTGFAQTLYYRKNNVSKAFEPIYEPNLAGCVIGIDKALLRDSNGKYSHPVSPSKIALSVSCFPLTATGAPAKAGAGEINTKIFYYSDTTQSGLAREDDSLIYLPFEQAQQLCGMARPVKRASAIHIKFKPNIKLEVGCKKVALLWDSFKRGISGEKGADLERVTVQSWKDYRRAFIAPMEKEQTMLTVMFALVGITTVFIIFVVFYMIVSHKSKDIGILKSIGVSGGNIIELFLGFAFLLGSLGSGAGAICGWLFLLKINQIENWFFEHFKLQLWDRTIYVIGDIPNKIEFKMLAIIIISAIFACLVGALVPTCQAARLKPIETLQVSRL
jgi:lipoprotein-releasing system permease protein